MQLLFASFETDGDGEIDAGEFRSMLRSIGVAMKDEEIDQVFVLLDADGGGTINCDEFA
eukprot:SAG11_NODE_8855_length_969_cov_1.634483_1_plen_58_part_10